MWKADLDTKVKVIAARLEYLDDLEAKLEFPACIKDAAWLELRPLWDYYSNYMGTWHNGPYTYGCPPHPVNLAWALVGYEEVDGTIAELIEADRVLTDSGYYESGAEAAEDKKEVANALDECIRHRCRLIDVAAVMSFNRTLNYLSTGVRHGEEDVRRQLHWDTQCHWLMDTIA